MSETTKYTVCKFAPRMHPWRDSISSSSIIVIPHYVIDLSCQVALSYIWTYISIRSPFGIVPFVVELKNASLTPILLIKTTMFLLLPSLRLCALSLAFYLPQAYSQSVPVTGTHTGIDPVTGARPLRRNILDLQNDVPSW